ncbi:MAG TPA: antibiotic biosynthesis monooxygenase family protein [Nitrospira sp.]|nr:antibiotic biosynthesis monooxygenase family protein [Nitrospira sp.]
MVVEYTRYRIPSERHQEFQTAYGKAQEYLKDSPYCLGYELSHCTEEPERLVLRIEWTSTKDHLEGFRRDDSFKEFFALVQPFIRNIEEMQHYELTDVAGTGAGSREMRAHAAPG